MTLQELEVVRGILRETPLDISIEDVGKARSDFEEMVLANLPVAEDATFEETTAGGVPAWWSGAPETASSERVLLYFHGGAYSVGSAHGYRAVWSGLARAAGARGLGPEYRLAPEALFPAAVEDCLAVYRSLLDDGRSASDVVFAGDSAGGGLVLATLLAVKRDGLPQPAGALAISPWVDLTCSGESYVTRREADLTLDGDGLRRTAARYLGDADPEDPLASPVFADLSGIAPLLIQVGTDEILLSDSTLLAARAAAHDVRVNLEVWPGMPHVWHSFAFMLSEGAAAIASAAAFLDAAYKGELS